VGGALVCAVAYEVARGQVPGSALAPAAAAAAAPAAPQPAEKAVAAPMLPCTPQKPQRRSPRQGRTPQVQTPHSWGSSPHAYGGDFSEDELDLSLEDMQRVVECLDGDDDVATSVDASSPAQGPLAGSPGQRRLEGADRRGGDGGGRSARQRRSGGPLQRGGGGHAAPRESKPPPPPPSGSLKALPAEHVQRFLKLVQEGDYAEALRALRKVRRAVKGRGCSKEAFGGMRALLHHLLEGYASAGRLSEALELLGDMKRGTEARLVSAAAFNAMLRGLLARGALEEARFIVREEMPRLGVSPNEASLNLLMDTAARAGPAHLDEAWDVLDEMQRRSLRADKYTVSILTKGISDRSDKRRAPRGVTLVEHFLRTQPDDVDEVLVNSLLDVFCRLGDMPRLEATLQRMREYGIRGSAVTYGTIVKAYGRAGNIEKVLQAWAEMGREGLEANAVTYGCMLDACVKCGHLDKALHVFSVMKEKGLHKNTILYATLIKGFAKSKDPSAARALHREMVMEGVLCNVVVFNSLIDACVRANDLHGAAEVLQQMTAAGVRPDLITFSTLIKGYCSNGELNKAMRLTEELQARELECDEIVYNSLLEGCVKAGDLQLGLRLFTEMRQRSVRPSSVTFSILVKLLSRAGRLDLACHLVAREMREMHGVAPTRMVWSCLVTCCVKARDLGRAVMVLDLIDREGGAAGGARASMYATVVEGCLAQSEISTALALCDRAYGRAPTDEGARGLLSADLLRRVFEAVGVRGPEAEARTVLENISPRLGETVRASLEDALNRDTRRRSPRGHGRGERDSGRAIGHGARGGSTSACFGEISSLSSPAGTSSSAAAVWPGGVVAAAQQWQAPAPYPPPQTPFLGCEPLQGAMAAGNGFPGWDPAVVAAAAATAAGNWAWTTGAEGYPYGYGAEAFYGAGVGAWHCPQPWDEGLQHWAYAGGCASGCIAATAPSAAPVRGVAEPPPAPVGAPAPDTPGPQTRSAAVQVETPCAASACKADAQTPATTAGRSSLLRSPAEEDDEDAQRTPVQVRLFASDALGASAAKEGAGEQVPLSVLLEGPPGLC